MHPFVVAKATEAGFHWNGIEVANAPVRGRSMSLLAHFDRSTIGRSATCYGGIYVDPLLLARRVLDGPAYRP
jgi:hypothetical protein